MQSLANREETLSTDNAPNKVLHLAYLMERSLQKEKTTTPTNSGFE